MSESMKDNADGSTRDSAQNAVNSTGVSAGSGAGVSAGAGAGSGASAGTGVSASAGGKGSKKKKKMLSLKTKTLIINIVIALLLIIAAMVTSVYVFSDYITEEYTVAAASVTQTAIDLIDPNEVAALAQTLQKDDTYDANLKMLQTLKDNNGVKYLYIQVRNGDTVTYLYDTTEEGEANPLGYQEDADASLKRETGHAASIITNTKEYGWLITYYNPITVDGKEVALVGADISMNNVVANMFTFFINCIIFLLILTAVIVFLVVLFVNKKIVSPIMGLSHITRHFVEHQNDNWLEENINSLHIRSKDEIENLSDSIRGMDGEMKKYLQNLTTVTAEKERISTELSVATQIQADMLPRIFPPYPDRKEFDLYATMTPAKEVGGDLYDFFMIDDDHLSVVIGDVSGKGVPAALFMVISKTLIKNYAMMGLPVDEIFTRANNDLCEGNEAQLFTTAWIGIFEISTGIIRFADAGHELAIVLKPDGTVEYLKPKKKKMMLAAMEDTKYLENEGHLDKGDMLLLYTDGVTEATNAHNELYGMERLEAIVSKHRGGNAKALLTEIRADIDTFVAEAPQFDDITMLGLEIYDR